MWQVVSVVCCLFVWPHGITDLWQFALTDVLLCYLSAGLVAAAAPDPLPVFLLASFVHLGSEDGWVGALMVFWSVACALRAVRVSEVGMAVYMILIHVPAHYRRVKPRRLALIAIAALALCFTLVRFDPYIWPRLTTALVLGHTVLNAAAHQYNPA